MRQQIPVFRLRCRPCRLTVTLLPEFLLPHARYALGIVQAAIDAHLGGTSCRDVAIVLSGAELPTGPSVTDALTWIKIVPSYQRVHAWIAGAVITAASGVQSAAAWLVRNKPDALAVHLLTTPGERRAGHDQRLASLLLLARLFSTDPSLNPRHTGWLTAWHRFATLILSRRAPPREPQTS